MQIGRDFVALGDDLRCLVPDLRIARPDRPPELAQLVAAVTRSHMRQHVDRGMGEEVDILGAAGQRALDVAAAEGFEQMQHALPVQRFDRHAALVLSNSAAETSARCVVQSMRRTT